MQSSFTLNFPHKSPPPSVMWPFVKILWPLIDIINYCIKQEAFEKCWAHSPLRAAHCHSPGVATVARRHCRTPSSMSTTTTTTTMTTRDRWDRYGPIEWAQISAAMLKQSSLQLRLISTLDSAAPSGGTGDCCFTNLSRMLVSRATLWRLDVSAALSMTGSRSRQKWSRSVANLSAFSESSTSQARSHGTGNVHFIQNVINNYCSLWWWLICSIFFWKSTKSTKLEVPNIYCNAAIRRLSHGRGSYYC